MVLAFFTPSCIFTQKFPERIGKWELIGKVLDGKKEICYSYYNTKCIFSYKGLIQLEVLNVYTNFGKNKIKKLSPNKNTLLVESSYQKIVVDISNKQYIVIDDIVFYKNGTHLSKVFTEKDAGNWLDIEPGKISDGYFKLAKELFDFLKDDNIVKTKVISI